MTSRRRSPMRAKTADVAGVRIIGGLFRGRKLAYSGDLRTRPMKDRVREALFNLLGRAVKGKSAIDLFAGTGALALEALSRGASRAIAVEMHRPTVRLIWQNAASLGIERRPERLAEQDGYFEVVTGDAFLWARKMPDLGTAPWVVFCSPPYEFYVSRKDDMLGLLKHLIDAAPAESLFAVEADERLDFTLLPKQGEWDIRRYPPAVLGIWEKRALIAGHRRGSRCGLPTRKADLHVSAAQQLQRKGHRRSVAERFAANDRLLGHVDARVADKPIKFDRRKSRRAAGCHDAAPGQALYVGAVGVFGGGAQRGARFGRRTCACVDDLDVAGREHTEDLVFRKEQSGCRFKLDRLRGWMRRLSVVGASRRYPSVPAAIEQSHVGEPPVAQDRPDAGGVFARSFVVYDNRRVAINRRRRDSLFPAWLRRVGGKGGDPLLRVGVYRAGDVPGKIIIPKTGVENARARRASCGSMKSVGYTSKLGV